MRAVRRTLDRIRPAFGRGGRLRGLRAVYEMVDTIAFTPGRVTRTASHVRDGSDLKWVMSIVVLALVPPMVVALYNTGAQALEAIQVGAAALPGWRMELWGLLRLPMDPSSAILCLAFGSLYFVPALVVTFAVGGTIEVLFASVRRHEVNEGFFVTGFLIPLILPPATPLWQVGLATAFGVIFGKEVFGGTGMNIFNPALVSRAFLFFAYPAEISGDSPWVAADFSGVDGTSSATLLASLSDSRVSLTEASWMDAFMGGIPGSMGETSTLACLLGAALLLYTGVASFRIMAGVVLGTVAMSVLFNGAGSDTNPMFVVPFWWHMVLGGWAFGTVYMATDPVTSSVTNRGRWVFGFGIGALAVLIRVTNPAYPEGIMLSILFMNMMAPLIDHMMVRGSIRRRRLQGV